MQEVGADNAKIGWINNGRKQPVIMANILKNKSFFGSKGKTFFKLYEDSISIEEIDESEICFSKPNTQSNTLLSLQGGDPNPFDDDMPFDE